MMEGMGAPLRRLPTLTGLALSPISEEVPKMALGSAWSSTWSSSFWQSGRLGSAAWVTTSTVDGDRMGLLCFIVKLQADELKTFNAHNDGDAHDDGDRMGLLCFIVKLQTDELKTFNAHNDGDRMSLLRFIVKLQPVELKTITDRTC